MEPGDDEHPAGFDPALEGTVRRGGGAVSSCARGVPCPRRSIRSGPGTRARNRVLVALGRDQEAEHGIEEVLALGDSFGDLAFPMMAAAGTAVHLGLGERAVVIGEIALERVERMGADGSETLVTYALGLCQTGQAELAMATLENVEIDFPYAHATRAIAAALCGDPVLPIADAEAVWAFDGSTYLDRVIADIAAGATELRIGQTARGVARLERSRAIADQAGDVVAKALSSYACSVLIATDDRSVVAAHEDHLRSGWRRVIAGLAGVDAVPTPNAR